MCVFNQVSFGFAPHCGRRRQGATFEVLNPATEGVVSVCANAGEEDVDEAVKAARAW